MCAPNPPPSSRDDVYELFRYFYQQLVALARHIGLACRQFVHLPLEMGLGEPLALVRRT